MGEGVLNPFTMDSQVKARVQASGLMELDAFALDGAAKARATASMEITLDAFQSSGEAVADRLRQLSGEAVLDVFHMEQSALTVKVKASASFSWDGFTTRGFGPGLLPVPDARRAVARVRRSRWLRGERPSRRIVGNLPPQQAGD
jgi:hypothetical protein